MKAIYLVPRKIYLQKMSRVRFHQIEEIAKHCDLTYSGNGWDNYRDEETVSQNLKRLYQGDLPHFIIGFDHRGMKEFNLCKVPKINMMNEMHSPEGNKKAALEMLLSAGYDFIICHHKNEMEENVFDPIRDRMVHIPHHVNTSIFKDYNLNKNIDVLLCGSLKLEKYRLRRKFVKVIDILKKSNINAKIHQHPGGNHPDAYTNKYLIEFAKKINSAKICLTCSSIHKCAYGKYSEIPACKSLLAGDIPDERQDFFRSFMLEINEKQNETEVASTIQNLLNDEQKLNYLTKIGFQKTQQYSMDNYAKLFMCNVKKYLKGRVRLL